MYKRKKAQKFGRKTGQRKALLVGIASSLVVKEKIKTSEAKAKKTSKFIEKFITRSKKGDIASRRLLAKFFNPKIVKKLCNDIGPRYKNRAGGYTRIIKLGSRKNDAAKMAIIELVK